ncbi:MAG: hypothetical protein ACQKBV_00910 [Puniceicoccales bacterium]
MKENPKVTIMEDMQNRKRPDLSALNNVVITRPVETSNDRANNQSLGLIDYTQSTKSERKGGARSLFHRILGRGTV